MKLKIILFILVLCLQPISKADQQPEQLPTKDQLISALFYACHNGLTESVEEILQYKFDINAIDSNGNTPLQIAEMKNHLDIVYLLSLAQGSQNRTFVDSAKEKSEVKEVSEIQKLYNQFQKRKKNLEPKEWYKKYVEKLDSKNKNTLKDLLFKTMNNRKSVESILGIIKPEPYYEALKHAIDNSKQDEKSFKMISIKAKEFGFKMVLNEYLEILNESLTQQSS
jgi:hypothetical protein